MLLETPQMIVNLVQIWLESTDRVVSPLDGAGLKILFHNGRGRNDDFDWFSFDDVTKRKLLRQNKLDRGHCEIGPALI